MKTKLSLKTRLTSLLTASIILTAYCPAQSSAALIVIVTGDANGSGSTWVFNGTSEVSTTFTLTSFGAVPQINWYVHNGMDLSGDLVSEANGNSPGSTGHSILGGTATGSSSGAFFFDGIGFSSDGIAGTGADDFAWLLGTQPVHEFIDGETLTFDNYTLQTDIDITRFGEGATAITANGDVVKVDSSSTVLGDLTIRFEAVPEPSSSLLFSIGLISLIVRRARS
ncbi:MAG: PEP-CTERM sorting domain-containing protein [Akkermansiaceae bacterium]